MSAMSRLRFAATASLALASIVLLSGCTVSQDAYADLRGDQETHDELPRLADYAYDNVDVSTSRFVGEYEGTSLWLAQGLEDSSICIVAAAADDAWVAGCGSGTTKISGITGTFEAIPDGAIGPEGATRVSENVYAW